MGRRQVTLNAYASLSSHWDEQDERDLQTWRRFVSQVREIARRPEFAELGIIVDPTDDA